MITKLRRRLLALSCLVLSTGLLAACGGGDDAKTILDQTFGASASSIDNGSMELTFQLDPEGLLALGGPIKLKLDGPFSAPSAGKLPRFDIDFVATLARQDYAGSLLSTGSQAYLTAGETPYKVDEPFVAKLRKGLSSSAGRPGLKALGIDPLQWIEDPAKQDNEPVSGVDTIRITATVDSEALLADLDALLTRAGGAGSAGDEGGLLSPDLRARLAEAVKSSTVDIWTGAEDKLVRQLAVRLVFAFDEGKVSPVQGLEGGTINLRLRLSDLNKTKVSAGAPAGAKPLSELTGKGLDTLLEGIGSGLAGGAGSASGRDFLRCITSGQGDTAALIRCISKVEA